MSIFRCNLIKYRQQFNNVSHNLAMESSDIEMHRRNRQAWLVEVGTALGFKQCMNRQKP